MTRHDSTRDFIQPTSRRIRISPISTACQDTNIFGPIVLFFHNMSHSHTLTTSTRLSLSCHFTVYFSTPHHLDGCASVHFLPTTIRTYLWKRIMVGPTITHTDRKLLWAGLLLCSSLVTLW
ncbi:hypothetical protein Hypma_010416 [Hypsizygus marmoreus]|uniref:Uncharacterized protein n=1 Tax=Hypsizygus marmoreus TaxID=39966 RepID=A0A369JPW4_HYPMA|nr:hypothetical protein Hypma_010416 [Hypsizygus marmoreus]